MISRAEQIFELHPHPGIEVRDDRTIVAVNNAAKALLGPNLIGRTCCEALFGSKDTCVHRCLERSRDNRYIGITASGVRTDPPTEEHYITVVHGNTANAVVNFMFIHPIPPLIDRIRNIRQVENQILAANTIDEVLVLFRDFLVIGKGSAPYCVRQYAVDNERRPSCIECIWHDSVTKYIPNLIGKKLHRGSPLGASSFYSLDQLCVLLVTASESEVDFFKQSYHAKQESTTSEIFVSQSTVFPNIRLFRLLQSNETLQVFADSTKHTWLDIPFGTPGHLVGKMSVSPQGPNGHFRREEMEEISTLLAVANTQIANLRARQNVRREALLGTLHEVAQPALMALTSIETLRRKDRQNNLTAEDDKHDYYIKKNIETAVRMVTFLNDSERISRDKPCNSPVPTNILGAVLAPIVNMLRHQELARQLTKGTLLLAPEHLQDLQLTDAEEFDFSLNRHYKIHYNGMFAHMSLYVDTYRLQEIFYNLFNNASKYHDVDTPLTIGIDCPPESALTKVERDAYSSFHVIDVSDNGLGISEKERTGIFSLGVRGSSSTRISDHTGTGRGLFIVREILLSIGGDIYVQSLSHPTVFRLFIPKQCESINWPEKLPLIRQSMESVRHLHRHAFPK